MRVHEQLHGSRASAVGLGLAAAALWALFWLFAHTDRSLGMRGRQMLLFFAAFTVFLVAVRIIWRVGARASARLVWFITGAGIVFRLSVAPALPVTTSDIYRYLWEGRVVRAGFNPFSDAPDSERLARLRSWPWEWVDFKQVPAAYPPVAQYVFAVSDWISAAFSPAGRVVALKLMLAAFDIGTVLLLPGLLVRLGRPPAWALLYAWHPLVVGDVVARGHLDSIGIFFLVLAARLLLLGSLAGRGLAGAALGASVLAKGYALLALPFLLLAARPHRVSFAAGLLAVTAGAYLPFARPGAAILGGIGLYSRYWEGNSSVYSLVRLALAPLAQDPALVARWICVAALLAWVLLLLVRSTRGGEELDALDLCFLSLAGFFLLSPAAYPWYLAWSVPFLCLRPRPAWLLLTGTIFGFYGHDLAGHRVEIWWVTVLEYLVPLLAGAVLALGASRGSSPAKNSPHSGRFIC